MGKIFLSATLLLLSVAAFGGEPQRTAPQSSPLDKSTYFQITAVNRFDNLAAVTDVDDSRYLDVRLYTREVNGKAANLILAIDQINMMTKRLVNVKYALSRVTSAQMTAPHLIVISGVSADGKAVTLEVVGSFDADARLRDSFATLVK
jgi:hypothetical protein